jgi:hypothetical protein
VWLHLQILINFEIGWRLIALRDTYFHQIFRYRDRFEASFAVAIKISKGSKHFDPNLQTLGLSQDWYLPND